MPEPYWWKDPAVLFGANNWTNFFPDPDAPMSDAYNALVRFTIYGGVLLWLVTQNMRYLIAIPAVMLSTFALHAIYPPKEGFTARQHIHHISCTKPTADNPYMNLQVHEISSNPQRSPACDLSLPAVSKAADSFLRNPADDAMDMNDSRSRKALERSFVAQPVSTVPNDLDSVKKFFYGDWGQSRKHNFEGYVPMHGSQERPM